MSAKKSPGLETTNVERVWVATSRTPVLVKELATATGLTSQATTAALKKLEAAAAVERSATDPKMWLRVKGVRSLPEQLRPVAPVEPVEAEPVAERKAPTMKRAELVELATSLGVEGITTKTKVAELVASIEAARAEQAATAEADAQLDKAPKAKLLDMLIGLGVTPARKATAEQLRALIRGHVTGGTAVAVDPSATGVTGVAVFVDGQLVGGAAETAAEPSNVIAGPWGTPGDVEAVTGDPDGVDGVLADLMAARPVSAPPAPAPRQRANASTDPRPRREAGGAVPVRGDKSTQWGRGQLAAAIVAVLDERGPEWDCTASGMTKVLNESRAADGTAPIAQAGAVKYALERLVDGGTAVRTSEAPKRYTRALLAA